VSRQSRIAMSTVLGSIALTAACSGSSSAGPTLPSCGAHGSQLTLAVAQYRSVDPASDSGCVTFAANMAPDTVEYLVLPWSNGGNVSSGGNPSAPFVLQSATPTASAMFAQMGWQGIRGAKFAGGGAQGARGPVAVAFDRFLRETARSPSFATVGAATLQSSGPARAATAGPPLVGTKRTFKVCASVKSCTPPISVGAVAKSVGAHIAIYVDTLAPSPGLSQSDLDSLRGVFDSRLYPLDTATFGGVSDIDSNTVVIVLMTNAVNKLVTASDCNANGYVAGYFFPADLDPQSAASWNNGEIFYSIVADSLGTLSCAHKPSEVNAITPVTFTHEFQHMINFVQHDLIRSCGCSEDGWLDEGLSKYAEELAGRSFLASGDTAAWVEFAIGDVVDAYQYLTAPQGSALLIPLDQGTLPEVGASWLFTRFIVDRFGSALPGKLSRTSLFGIQNVQTQTGQAFDSTVTQWALANWVSDLPGFTAPAELQYTTWHFRTTYRSLYVQDSVHIPRLHDFTVPYPLVPIIAADNAVNLSGTLHAGSGAYLRVMQAPNGAAFTLHFGGPGGAAVSPAVVPRLNVLRIR